MVKKFYQPTPRILEGAALARTGCVTSMMDISDGLALSLHDLAAASGVGFFITFEDIPINEKVKDIASDNGQLVEWSVYTGGDFELLFTLRPEYIKKVSEVADFTIIGKVTSGSINIQRNGHIEVIEARGFQQFGDNI
ncbi:MAG: hypothetical protein GWP12_01935 [Nitrospirae bacterium]|nr:hypothetical protein [Nitrospirota bacterium]